MIVAETYFRRDGDRAWLVTTDPERMVEVDRPCATCGDLMVHGGFMMACCGATGQQRFELEVQGPSWENHRTRTTRLAFYEASVIRGRILPITHPAQRSTPEHVSLLVDSDGEHAFRWKFDGVGADAVLLESEPVLLPPAAKPGMIAVELRVRKTT